MAILQWSLILKILLFLFQNLLPIVTDVHFVTESGQNKIAMERSTRVSVCTCSSSSSSSSSMPVPVVIVKQAQNSNFLSLVLQNNTSLFSSIAITEEPKNTFIPMFICTIPWSVTVNHHMQKVNIVSAQKVTVIASFGLVLPSPCTVLYVSVLQSSNVHVGCLLLRHGL